MSNKKGKRGLYPLNFGSNHTPLDSKSLPDDGGPMVGATISKW